MNETLKKNDKITLLVPKKFRETFDVFCKTMGFTVLSSERLIRESRIASWEDIYKKITDRLGPSYQKPEDFIEKLITLSPAATLSFLSIFIVEVNNPERKEAIEKDAYLYAKDIQHTCEDVDFQAAIGIIRSKLLPLLYDEGKQEGKECNADSV